MVNGHFLIKVVDIDATLGHLLIQKWIKICFLHLQMFWKNFFV